ncbi:MULTISPECIES: hypothetical protein [unclassified Chryseobacterium]|uniref:hypothetical protein n=1 Tax=unclassified Chryseobacterium TaxID=2593645 RepID=UPI00100B030F|nr:MULTISPECIES: hypothetical protein [unclassified Chryseobacterium]RXM49651.1 hypothetical protein BOQ64_22400 [Chryseobacterium sp. CH25]RXM61854.1 hypothetical protein BOQ60_22990 [Chryseobacterium sp. CH1]
MKFRTLFLLLIVPIFSLKAQNKVEEYLGIPGPISLGQKVYHLAWSSHPNDMYFKQEYIEPKENINKYNSMVLIDFVKGDFNLKEVIDRKIAELDEMKKINPIVNYQILEKDGEYILDFLISENSKDGKEVLIAERNVYRYKLITKDANKGLLLFAISQRGYQENMDQFFKNLKTNSSQLIETVGNYKIPEIKIK